jgi:hypothetical protein
MLSKGIVKLAQGLLWSLDRKGRRKGVTTLTEAMAKDAECGCGIDCNCYGYVVLPNWDSTAASTEPVDSRALFIVDATLYIGTVAEAQAVIDGIKAGTPWTPVGPVSLGTSSIAAIATAAKEEPSEETPEEAPAEATEKTSSKSKKK